MEMRCSFCHLVGDIEPGILKCPNCQEEDTLFPIEQFEPDFFDELEKRDIDEMSDEAPAEDLDLPPE